MDRRVRILTVLLLAAAAAGIAPTASADAGVEAQVMAKIRASRPGGLIQHAGLLAVARAHSMDMARQGRMSHDNADARIRNAPADPAEANGGPDDGQPVAAWCENVTYSVGHPASEVPGRLYSQWAGSGAHARCMRDTSRNVGAVGVYYDGSTWWATFIATVDKTPPGGSPTPRATSTPKPVAAQEPAPAATTAPSVPQAQTADEPSDASDTQPQASAAPAEEEMAAVEDADATRSIVIATTEDDPVIRSETVPFAPVNEPTLGYGMPELSALAAVLVIALLMFVRRVRRPASVQAEGPLHVLGVDVEAAVELVPRLRP